MAFGRLLPLPGVNSELSPTLNRNGYAASNLIRFREGLPEKLGGWTQFCPQAVTGTGLGMHSWADSNGITYLMVGTDQRLQVVTGGALYDITPIRATTNAAPNFSTVSGNPAVTIVDAGSNTSTGDWIYIMVPVSIGGIVLQGFYQVSNVDANTYTVTASTPAATTVNNAGAVPLFTTTNTSATVQVTLANHGLVTGAAFTVEVSTTGNNVTLLGQYTVTVTGPNTFTIGASTTANASGNFSENGGNARLVYFIQSGLAQNTALSGYGAGAYGGGDFGLSNGSTLIEKLRQWTGDSWGSNLVCNYTGGPIYQFVPPPSGTLPGSETTNPAAAIVQAPSIVTTLFVHSAAQILVACGCNQPGGGGNFNPLLVAWSDQANNALWIAASGNQAGQRQLYSGSRIVGAMMTGQGGLIWTDADLWSMQYIGYPEVFGFTKVGQNCGLIAMRAAGALGSTIYWMGSDNFYVSSPTGGVAVLPCKVWDIVFRNLNSRQLDEIHCAVNPLFNEVAWFFPSAAAPTGLIDTYVKYNAVENTWDYGSLVRTCWDEGLILSAPVGCDGTSLIQQHETSPDANGAPLAYSYTTGYFDLGNGEEIVQVDQLWPDFVASSNSIVQLTINVVDYPQGAPRTYGPYAFNATTGGGPGGGFIPFNARGRQMSLTVAGNDLGSFTRLGGIRYRYAAAGRR